MLIFRFKLVPALFKHLFCSEDCSICLVVQLDLLTLLLVVGLELFGSIHHLLDIFFREFLVSLDGDGLLVA